MFLVIQCYGKGDFLLFIGGFTVVCTDFQPVHRLFHGIKIHLIPVDGKGIALMLDRVGSVVHRERHALDGIPIQGQCLVRAQCVGIGSRQVVVLLLCQLEDDFTVVHTGVAGIALFAKRQRKAAVRLILCVLHGVGYGRGIHTVIGKFFLRCAVGCVIIGRQRCHITEEILDFLGRKRCVAVAVHRIVIVGVGVQRGCVRQILRGECCFPGCCDACDDIIRRHAVGAQVFIAVGGKLARHIIADQIHRAVT